MKLTHLLLVCHVYVLLLARREILSFEQVTLDWFSAQKKCKAQNSILRTEIKHINATGTFKFWRGLYTRYSSWIKIVGCYADNVTETYSPFYKMQELSTSVGFCQEICISYNFLIFAVKGNLCRCLGKLPTEKQLVPSFCNTTCLQSGTRNYEPYFRECGGNGTYSVYISGTKDERKPNLPGIFCVAMKCSQANSSFHFEESCSKSYPPVCKNADGLAIEQEEKELFLQCELCSYVNGTYKECTPMGCKETKKVSLICVQMDQDKEIESTSGSTAVVRISTVDSSQEKSKLTSESIQSLATQTIMQATERTFTGKQNTTTESTMDQYKNKKSSSQPTDRSSIKQEQSQPTSKSYTTQSTKVTTESSSTGKPNTTSVYMTYSLTNATDIIETITPIPTRERTTLEGIYSNDYDEALETTIPISIAAVIGGIFLVLFFIYLCYWKKRHQTGTQKTKSKHEEVSHVAGIVNATYFTIELKEQGNLSSDMEEKIENLNIKADEETYHHLREKDLDRKKYDNECNYDTSKNVNAKEKTEKYNHNSEGTYDHLGDKRCNTIADDTYHHACTVKKDRSDYDVTEIRKQYILDSLYNHVEIVQNENDPEQDTISNFSETQNEDHTYFILEQN